MTDIAGRSVAVLGAGKSGVAAANLLAGAGAERVVLSDLRAIDDLDVEALSKEVELVTGHNDLADAGLVVTSPGVPPTASPLRQAKNLGLPVWSEIELAYRLMPDHARLLAITGTDGKSTVTTMLAHIQSTSRGTRGPLGRRPVWVGGNLGTPFCQAVLDGALDRDEARAVVEISCFQLLFIEQFRPHVASLLNIAEDHLDIHGDLDSYAAAKGRIFENMKGPDDVAVYRADDARCAKAVDASAARQIPFALTPEVLRFWSGHPLPVLGAHNVLNAEAATLMAEADGIGREAAAEALATYRPLSHRLELIVDDPATGVRWINDSKATNPHAAATGLRSLSADAGGRLILLAGGVDKGLSLGPLVGGAREAGVRHAIIFGAIGERLATTLTGPLPSVRQVTTLQEAVALARDLAERGDTVVLSPACSSFDQFDSYAHRGETFRSLVRPTNAPHDHAFGEA